MQRDPFALKTLVPLQTHPHALITPFLAPETVTKASPLVQAVRRPGCDPASSNINLSILRPRTLLLLSATIPSISFLRPHSLRSLSCFDVRLCITLFITIIGRRNPPFVSLFKKFN
uniref:Uncharacterized protein n=1 Tax=CrAss-like virus sp. ctYsL76 TaxID=2826826 RepID=A0A8S5QN86_9CAUD|nr:MAG TPA: hypothetical protein [CrAss-like virus sp. ctYsL76]